MISPDGTHNEIVVGLQYNGAFELCLIVGERSAAYMAVGMAVESGEPVAIICTESVASRNYLLAMTEVYYRQLPILAITDLHVYSKIGIFIHRLLTGVFPLKIPSFARYSSRRLKTTMIYHPEYGPIEFLSALSGATVVVTDSYHGTILSVNFEKELYSICKLGGSEFRKTDILERLGLQDRIIYDPNDMVEKTFEPIDYKK